jgi:hypothetical protein
MGWPIVGFVIMVLVSSPKRSEVGGLETGAAD